MMQYRFQELLVMGLVLTLSLAALVQDGLEARRNFVAEAGLAVSDVYHPLTRGEVDLEALQTPPFLGIEQDGLHLRQISAGSDFIKAASRQTEYLMSVGIGDGVWNMIPDSGSSDTWLMSSNFTCLDRSHRPQQQSYCRFGPSYPGAFSGGKIEDMHMNITYGGGDSLTGDMGFADVTVAEITVPKQQMSLVTKASIRGNGIMSGILGLGLRALTTAYKGSDPMQDGDGNRETYSPLIETMTQNGTVDPVWSVAMSRDDSRSFISFGGVPPNVTTGEFASAPLHKMRYNNGPPEYIYYAIEPESLTWNTSETHQNWSFPEPMVVDTGTTLNYFPDDVAFAINNLFQPPALYGGGPFRVLCDAIPPTVEIGIGGKTFKMDPTSLILPQTLEVYSDGDYCLTGIAGGSSVLVLGDVFLQELLVVFDVSDKKEMKFAQRTDKK